MRVHIAAACLLLLLCGLPITAQQSSERGSIEGTVTRSGSGEPIPGARVTLGVTVATSPGSGAATAPSPAQSATPLGSVSPSTVTDGQGKFSFRDLYPGAYRVSAGANGYAKQEYGQRTFGGPGTPIIVGARQAVKDVEIELVPGGNITGRIRDNAGQGVVGVQIQLLRPLYNLNGAKTYQPAGTARSDDRGEYRLFWITPGRYLVLAGTALNGVSGSNVGSPNEISGDGVPPTYYPGSQDLAQAGTVDVKAASEIGGVDIFVNRQSPYRIRGRVIDARTGQTPASVNLTLGTITATGAINYSSFSQSYNPQDGSFEIRDVTPGPHLLRAQPSVSNVVTPNNAGIASSIGNISATAQLVFNVVSDMDGIVLMLTNGASLSGRIILEAATGTGTPPLTAFRVQLRSSLDGLITPNLGGPQPQSQPTSAEGSFRIENVLPGEYRFSISALPESVYVKQAHYNQIDILDKPIVFSTSESGSLEVVLSTRGGEINGTVAADNRSSVQGSTAVLIPDRQRDRFDLYKSTTVDANGNFSIRGIAPGDYHVFVWEAIDPYAYFDPGFLRQNDGKGTPIHVTEMSKESVSVRSIRLEP